MRLYNRDGKYNIPPRFFRNRIEKWHRRCKNIQKLAHTSAVPSTTTLVCASFFKKMAAANSCYPIQKFNCCQNSFAATKTKIQNLQFNTYSIQNSKSNISNTTHTQFKIQVSTNTIILSINTNII